MSKRSISSRLRADRCVASPAGAAARRPSSRAASQTIFVCIGSHLCNPSVTLRSGATAAPGDACHGTPFAGAYQLQTTRAITHPRPVRDMIAHVLSAATVGIDAYLVHVEVDTDRQLVLLHRWRVSPSAPPWRAVNGSWPPSATPGLVDRRSSRLSLVEVL